MRALVVVAVVLLLAACGNDYTPKQGTVENKRFVPAYTDHYYTQQCVSYGKYGQCNISIPVSHDDYHAEHYDLYLRECTNPNGKQVCHEGWLTVDPGTYNRVSVGQHYPNPA